MGDRQRAASIIRGVQLGTVGVYRGSSLYGLLDHNACAFRRIQPATFGLGWQPRLTGSLGRDFSVKSRVITGPRLPLLSVSAQVNL